VKRNLAHMYDRLTAEERFRLVVEAFAREDELEVEHLSGTCPRKAYEMNDIDFVDRLKASQMISSYVCAELIGVLGMLRTIKVYREATELYEEALFSSLEWTTEEAALSYHQAWDEGCDYAWQVAGKRGPFPWNDKANLNERAKETAERIKPNRQSKADDGSQEPLEDIDQALSTRAQTVWAAYSRFCREQTSLEPETMLRACFPLAFELPEHLREAVGSAQADRTLLEDYEAMLVRTWHELVGN
jgi:hypothetical protein